MSGGAAGTRVAVVGGGAVGLTAAATAAERGASVVLFEREELASGATGRAAGLCYDAFAEDRDASAAAESLARLREMGVLEACPYVWFARDGDDAAAAAIREQVPRMRTHGRDARLVAPADLGERFPALRTDDVAVAAVSESAGHVDPDAYAAALAERCRAAGVDLRPDTPATLSGPRTVAAGGHEHAFDRVLVAAGAWTGEVVGALDVDLALGVYRAQAALTEAVDAALPMAYDAGQSCYWRPRTGSVLVGDGAHRADPADWRRGADDAFETSALARLRRATDLEPALARSWAGLCTATPDRDPLVGPVRAGLVVATGWHGHGLMRAPALGAHAGRILLGENEKLPYDPRRFDGDESVTVPEGLTVD